MLWWRQVLALLWKSYILRKRRPLTTLFELLVPLYLGYIMAPILDSDSSTHPSVRLKPDLMPAKIYSGPVYAFPENISIGYKGYWRSSVMAYAPQNKFTERVMSRVVKMFIDSHPKWVKGRAECLPFKDEQSMVDHNSKTEEPLENCLIVFHDTNDETTAASLANFSYTLRPPYTTSQVFPDTVGGNNYGHVNDNFITFQGLINEAFLSLKAQSVGKQTSVTNWSVWRFPSPPYHREPKSNEWLVSYSKMFATWLMCYLATCPILVKRFFEDKVNKSREMRRITGLSDAVYWGATYFNSHLIQLLQAMLSTFIYKWLTSASGFPETDMSTVFALFALHGAALLTFCMYLSILGLKPVSAIVVGALVSVIIFLVETLLFNLVDERNAILFASFCTRFFLCISPSYSFELAIHLIQKRTTHGRTVSWSTLFNSEPSLCLNNISLGMAMVAMAGQVLFYSCLIWFFDKVWPRKDGVSKPWYFPLQIQYWKSLFSNSSNSNRGPGSPYLERNLTELGNVVTIRNLRKRMGNKMAVDGVSVDIKQGEITCLLGHDGAGKTTTLDIITGLFRCMRHSRVYHGPNAKHAAIKQSYTLGMSELLAKKTSELADGMKRKLCVAIALVGNTQLVILDEPTRGLDPETRRIVWQALRKVRPERTILFSTHDAEEAEALADSVAIMTNGKISCHGTPGYLKNLFNFGYRLRVWKGEGYDSQALRLLISRHFPRGSVMSETDLDLMFKLESQNAQTDSSKIAELLRQLEQLKTTLGAAPLALLTTRLKDVFAKMATSRGERQTDNAAIPHQDENSVDGHQSRNSAHQLDFDEAHSRPDTVQGIALMYQRFKGLFVKRLHFGKRRWPMLILHMLTPALVFGFAMFNFSSGFSEYVRQSLEVTAIRKLYGTTDGFVENTSKLDTFKYSGEKHGIRFHPIATSENVTNYLLDVAEKVGLYNYTRKNLFGATVDSTGGAETYQLWYQSEAYHANLAVVNMLYEARLRELTGSEDEINVFSHSVPEKFYLVQWWVLSGTPELFSYYGLSVSLLGAFYVLFPVHERSSQSKLLQLMTGLPVWLFWFASFLFDLLCHTVASLLVLAVVATVGDTITFTQNAETTFSLLFLLILNGSVTITTAYCLSCLVKNPSTGYAMLFIMYSKSQSLVDSLQWTIHPVAWRLLKASPLLSFSSGVHKVYKQGRVLNWCTRYSKETLDEVCPNVWGMFLCCPEPHCRKQRNGYVSDGCLKPLWSWSDQGILQEATVMAASFALLSAILLITPYASSWIRRTFRCSSRATISDTEQEDDVSREADRVSALASGNDQEEEALLVHNLRRRFGKLVAVNDLSFGVHRNETFAILGGEGSGKTTTIRMLAGDIVPTAGDAQSGLLSVVDHRSRFQQRIGYYPQFDAFLNQMTGSETLFLFGRLRGVPKYLLQRQVNQLLAMSGLTEHAHKLTETYSGGNKRKLSLAIALIGSPKLLLLDEPTAGADPETRRQIWNMLRHVRRHHECSIIMTSHSMEECEALCSRLAIMVKGQFRCLGSVQHLRNKYGPEYMVTMTIKRDQLDSLSAVKQALQTSIRGAIVRVTHETTIEYRVTDTRVTWAELFEHLERIKQQFDLDDYSVSDSTLEQIFIRFAGDQQ
ncbi:Phospholipid-transporting ATPase ABCA3 [Halotydeus destructor]|nr:Phospholipid-transporting ATPase ABCA3 [Halotydeus destructor]